MKAILFLSTLILSFNSYSFSGKWEGVGEFKTHKSNGECSNIYLSLRVKNQKLYILEGGYSCDFINAEYPPSVFNIDGNNLLYKGRRVGKITNSQLTLSKEEFRLRLEKEGSQLIYKEIWQDNRSYLKIKGELERL